MFFDKHPKPIKKYKYWNREVPYRSEQFEISKKELKYIRKIQASKVDIKPCKSPNKPVKVIIDTDIGTDFDDTMALLYSLHLNIEILGLTTNYGISELRAKVAKKVTDAYFSCHPEKKPFPIIPGASCQLGTHRSVFLFGNEGLPFFEFEEIEKYMDVNKWIKEVQTEAADFIAETCQQYPGEVKIISIGIPTNIALALKRHPKIKKLIPEVIVMGGGTVMRDEAGKSPFPLPNSSTDILEWIKAGNIVQLFPNHNLSGDTMASKILFDSGIKLKIIPHDVTCRFWVEGSPIDFLRERAKLVQDVKNPTDPAGAAGLIMLEWFKRRRNQNGQCPHDPLTIHEALFGDDDSPLMYAPGTMVIHKWAAFGTFVPHSDGNHFVAFQTRNESQFLERLATLLQINDYPDFNKQTRK